MKVIITGAASGIGRAAPLRLAKLGGLSAVLADLKGLRITTRKGQMRESFDQKASAG